MNFKNGIKHDQAAYFAKADKGYTRSPEQEIQSGRPKKPASTSQQLGLISVALIAKLGYVPSVPRCPACPSIPVFGKLTGQPLVSFFH